LGVPCVSDRALQRSAAQVMSAIYEADFLPCSFGGRPGRGAHHALATLNEVIAGGKVGWLLVLLSHKTAVLSRKGISEKERFA